MSLKRKLGLPSPDGCLLAQAVEWLVSREPIISVTDDTDFPVLPGELDDAIYGEAKEALYLALRRGKMSATGIFYGNDPNTDPREDTDVEIGRRRWKWGSIDWVDSSLNSPYESGRYIVVWIKTKELFEIFGDPDVDRTERETNIENSGRSGRKVHVTRGSVAPAGAAPETRESVKGRDAHKLFKLKDWLTLADAAQHLSIILGEDVSEADVLRLALDRHLKLSARFVNKARARRGRIVPLEEAETFEMRENFLTGKTIKVIRGLQIREGEILVFDNEIVSLDGVWDLPMIGGEKLDVEHEYENQTGGPAVTLIVLDGTLVEGPDGTLYQLQEHFSDNEYFKKEDLKRPLDHADNYYPAGGLPSDSVFVVRSSALQEFEARISETSSSSTAPDPRSSGFPGRPSKGKHLIEQEFERRVDAGEVCSTLPEEAGALLEWLKEEHPSAPPPTVKTIKNNLRGAYRRINKSSARNSARN